MKSTALGIVRILSMGLMVWLGPAAPLFSVRPAAASVSIAVTFDELVSRSKAVATVTPIEQRAAWEGRAIITYTRVHVDDGIAGDATTGSEVWIASRGGTIGNIGQIVDGEP